MLIIKKSNKVAQVDNKFYNFFYLKSFLLSRVEKWYFKIVKIFYIEYSKSKKTNAVHLDKVDSFFATN